MKIFNAFQIMLLFSCAPFIIGYVKTAEFSTHIALFWVLLVAYVVGFGTLTAVVANTID